MFPPRPWDLALAATGALLVALLCVLAAITAVPPMLRNLASEASDGIAPVSLPGGVDVVVPRAWTVQRDGEDAVIVHTPDGGMSARLEAGDRSLSEDPSRTETLVSGLRVVHTDVGSDAVHAVVATDHGTVRVVATAGEGRRMADYRPALGQLLEGVRP